MTSKYARAEHSEFMDATAEALASANLQLALSRLGDTLAAGNRSAFEKLPGSSLLRERLLAGGCAVSPALACRDGSVGLSECRRRSAGVRFHRRGRRLP